MISQRSVHFLAVRGSFRALVFLAAVCSASWAAAATISVIKTSDGNGADTELREDESVQRGSAQDLNTRWEATPLNLEIIAVRFDLTGIDRNKISGASLELQAARNLPANQGMQYWGLNSDVANQNWTEGQTGANTPWNAGNPFPGLTHDSDLTTLPINASDTTALGSISWTSFPLAGQYVPFSNDDLVDFLQDGSGNLVTFFAFRLNASPSTQVRFGSKESEGLGNTGSTGAPPTISPDRAPQLVLTIIPEPASLALLGLGGVALVGLARRRS